MSISPPRVSVAIPLYNEEDGLEELLRRVRAVLDSLHGGPHEIVIVDDGSDDSTWELLEMEAARDTRLVPISLSRNFGHQAALTAALDYVTGDVTVVMDGDLQDPPELIPAFLEAYAAGNDVVYAKRATRTEAWWLRACYHLFYRLIGSLSSLRLPPDTGDFCLMSRRVVRELRRTRERNRFLRGLRAWVGFKQACIEVDRPERHAGKSKYGIRKLLGLAFDGIFAFSIVPIRAAVLVGGIAIALSSMFAIYALFAKLFLDQSPRGFTALTLLIVFLSGVHLFFVGIIGEYVGRVYEESKGRPIYIVARAIRRSGTGQATYGVDDSLGGQQITEHSLG
ncbi:MAG TPA: glycosyltransferase family 2 protein [Gemmatimonadaceae bacterium]